MANIAVLSYNKDKFSETFIANQVKHLQGNVHYLYGGGLPQYYGNNIPFVKPASKIAQLVHETVLGISHDQQHLNAIEKYLTDNKIDAVLANYAVTALPVMELCHKLSIPLIVHFHGWTAYRKSFLQEYGSRYPRLFNIAAAVVAVSNDMKQQLISLGAPAEKIAVVTCGADESMFEYNNHAEKRRQFLIAGRLCDTKNPHLSIQAFSMAAKQIPEATLIIAGGDEGLLNTCINLIKSLGIEGKVEYMGIQSHSEMQQLMQQSFAILQHSATTIEGEKEGTPVTLLEAALSGLPIIATKHAGIGEVFKDGYSALLCNELDVQQMAENIQLLANNKQLYATLSQNARQVVLENHTLSKYIETLNSVINKCVHHS